jgi:hypothetical protein
MSAIFGLALTQSALASAPCAFGEQISDLLENKRFAVKEDVIKTFKIPRTDANSGLIMVSISVIKDKKTGKEYQMNTTFRHKDDGDNTIGWVEEVTGSANEDGGVEGEGAVVAVIGDSEFEKCTVNQ